MKNMGNNVVAKRGVYFFIPEKTVTNEIREVNITRIIQKNTPIKNMGSLINRINNEKTSRQIILMDAGILCKKEFPCR